MAERLTQITLIRDQRKLGEYTPGDVGKPFQAEPAHWYIACPQCGGRAGLWNHTIVENEDGTITVSPSLLCPGADRAPDNPHYCNAHYFIERNQIRWV